MNIIHRPIDFEKDKDYILERHCRINYACETPWMRAMPYADYQAEWFSFVSQAEGFYSHLMKTARDEGTTAEILETEDRQTLGYLWAPFVEDAESGFCFVEIQDVYVEEAYRRQGVASALYRYVEEKARQHGAKVLRAGTGCENTASIQLHQSLGFSPYRYEFEKLL